MPALPGRPADGSVDISIGPRPPEGKKASWLPTDPALRFDLLFPFYGPEAPAGQEGRWIKTIPGKAWFVYFRIYGPEPAAFGGSWRPDDLEEVK